MRDKSEERERERKGGRQELEGVRERREKRGRDKRKNERKERTSGASTITQT